MGEYLLAHDLGTSGNKATLYREDGTLAASAVAAYGTSYPRPGWAEQDPEDWWHGVCSSTKELLARTGVDPKEVACVSFSGQMMGCLLTDREGRPLRPMMIWADTRSSRQEQEILDKTGMEKVYQVTGHRASAFYSAAKLLWIREQEPQVYDRACHMLQAKDYMIYRLTGQFVTDYSDAGGTNLFDIRKKEWSAEICDSLGIPMELLPEAHVSADVAGYVTSQAARACGLLEGTPVVIGGGDGACTGAGAVEEGDAYCVLGSSSWISRVDREPVFDRGLRTFNWIHLDPALYTPCGTMQAAGLSYSWYRDTFCGEEKELARTTGENLYDLLDRQIGESTPGAGGVLYLPYLLGERSPRWNHAARGAFIGMDVRTKKADLARAVLEGVGFNLKVILDILEEGRPGRREPLTLIGGGAKGKCWSRILADIWERPLGIPADPEEATSLGAAVCGGVGIGMYADYQVVKGFRKAAAQMEPDPAHRECYQAYYRMFNRAYEALVPVYEGLAGIGAGL